MDTIVNVISGIFQIKEVEILFKLLLITILAGFVGFERESWNKPAGFRTHILLGISAVLVMICGEYLFVEFDSDPTRIPAQLLSGIGFLGAGTILRDGFNVKGLTTAAGLLSITCIGLVVGSGYYSIAIMATIIVYIVLSYSHVLSERLDHYNFYEFEITAPQPKDYIDRIKTLLNKYDLEIVEVSISDKKEKDDILKVIVKVKDKIDFNKVIVSILKIDGITGVVEVK